MKLAISNIAWGRRLDDELLAFLVNAGAEAVELAPGLTELETDDQIAATAARLQQHRLDVVGLHSLLFEVPQLRIVNESHRIDLLEYCDRLARQCRQLGGRFLVFGSPRNRSLDGLSRDAAWSQAVDFFQQLGAIGVARNVTFLIEPLPDADLVRNHREGIKLVEAAASDGVSLHLDIRTMSTNGESPTAIAEQVEYLKHVHTGGANLSFAGPNDGIKHAAYAGGLKDIGYDGFVTLEMVRSAEAPDFAALTQTLQFTREVYCQ